MKSLFSIKAICIIALLVLISNIVQAQSVQLYYELQQAAEQAILDTNFEAAISNYQKIFTIYKNKTLTKDITNALIVSDKLYANINTVDTVAIRLLKKRWRQVDAIFTQTFTGKISAAKLPLLYTAFVNNNEARTVMHNYYTTLDSIETTFTTYRQQLEQSKIGSVKQADSLSKAMLTVMITTFTDYLPLEQEFGIQPYDKCRINNYLQYNFNNYNYDFLYKYLYKNVYTLKCDANAIEYYTNASLLKDNNYETAYLGKPVDKKIGVVQIWEKDGVLYETLNKPKLNKKSMEQRNAIVCFNSYATLRQKIIFQYKNPEYCMVEKGYIQPVPAAADWSKLVALP